MKFKIQYIDGSESSQLECDMTKDAIEVGIHLAEFSDAQVIFGDFRELGGATHAAMAASNLTKGEWHVYQTGSHTFRTARPHHRHGILLGTYENGLLKDDYMA